MAEEGKVELRPARDADILELPRLVAGIAAYHESIDPRARFDWDEIRDAPNWLKAVLHRDHHAIWVADHSPGRLVGYLWVHLRRDRQGYLPHESVDILATLIWMRVGAGAA